MLHKGSHCENIGTLQFDEPVSSADCFRQYSSKNVGLKHQKLHHCVRMVDKKKLEANHVKNGLFD